MENGFSSPTGNELCWPEGSFSLAYLTNRAVNLANLHCAMHFLAWNVAGLFFAVFLLKGGISPAWVLVSIAAILAFRLALRPLLLTFVYRVGLRRAMLLGNLVSAAQFLALGQVDGIGWPLAIFVGISALADGSYWVPFHAYFATIGDAEHRGRQLSVRQALFAVADIAGPPLGGALIAWQGGQSAFWLGAIIAVLGSIPLLWAPDVECGPRMTLATAWSVIGTVGFRLYLADGLIASGSIFAWQIILFGALEDSFVAFGLVSAAAGATAIVANLVLGKLVDDGHGLVVNRVAMALMTGNVAVRLIAGDNRWVATASNMAAALIGCLYASSFLTDLYNRAKRSPSPLLFEFIAEGGFDVGGIIGCLVAALIAAAGLPRASMAVAFAGIFMMALLRERLAAPSPP